MKFFNHVQSETNKSFNVSDNGRQLTVKPITVLFIADLVCKAKALNMKKCNGFYGCSLCVVRGKRKFGAHCYPHTDSIEMRDPRQHQRMADLAESGIVEKTLLNIMTQRFKQKES